MFLYRKTLQIPSKYVLYGERHSGTKFFDSVIQSVFRLGKNHEYGHKHFFGFADHRRISVDQKSIFFCIIRNPYSWISAMNSLPHHVPSTLLPLYDHLLDEWYSVSEYWKPWNSKPVTIVNKEIIEDRHLSLNRRYNNILELRNIKNQYLIKILPIYAQNIVIITYEELMNNYDNILDIVSKSFVLTKYSSDIKIVPPIDRSLPEHLIKQINAHMDWPTENSLGYTKI